MQINITKRLYRDCHCHLLPGLDDGPADMQESIEMSGILADLGFIEIICTPHLLKGVYDNRADKIQAAATSLQTLIEEKSIPLSLRAAFEYHLDEYLYSVLDVPLTVRDGVILVEAQQYMQPSFFKEISYQVIVRKKLRLLVAHPERWDMSDKELIGIRTTGMSAYWETVKSAFITHHEGWKYTKSNEGVLPSLRDLGCLFQGNIGSFAGIYGEHVRKRALRMLRMGIYDRLGTDAHRPDGLANWLEEGLKIIRQEVSPSEVDRLLGP